VRADPSPVSVSHHSRVSLDAGWAFARLSPGAATTPDALDASLVWQTASHATTAAAALRAANAWTHNDTLDFDAWDWWFRCAFPAPPTREDLVAHILHVGGLATLADVWLNGTHILHSDNMFLAHDVDVSTALRDENTLYIRCASLNTALREPRPRPTWRTRLVGQQQLRWMRTTLLGRMPGWSTTPQPVGPWRDVTLETRTRCDVISCELHPRVEGNDGVIELALRVRGTAPIARATGAVTLTTTSASKDQTQTVALHTESDGDTTRISATIRVPNAERWWPHTHGAQPRYDVTVTVHVGDAPVTVACGPVAFRTITLDTTDGNFEFAVNGVRVFCRGACWSSVDVVRLTGTDDDYRAALTLARDAGMNMLRVGGTMTYEADAFYDQCDALGILVWQDFMFANMDYPFGDDAFAASIHDEATQFLRRTHHRACLAVLCGNSEIEQQVSMLGLPKERWSHPFFQETLPSICDTYRPDIPYWPSSPSGGAFPFHVNAGDAHYFGYGPYLRSFDDVRTSGVRFASETLAFAHVPDQPTIDLLACGSTGAGHHPAWKRAFRVTMARLGISKMFATITSSTFSASPRVIFAIATWSGTSRLAAWPAAKPFSAR